MPVLLLRWFHVAQVVDHTSIGGETRRGRRKRDHNGETEGLTPTLLAPRYARVGWCGDRDHRATLDAGRRPAGKQFMISEGSYVETPFLRSSVVIPLAPEPPLSPYSSRGVFVPYSG